MKHASLTLAPDGVAEEDALVGVVPSSLASPKKACQQKNSCTDTDAVISSNSDGERKHKSKGGTGSQSQCIEEDHEDDALLGGECGKLNRPKSCYICKTRYRELHNFYSELCPTCAALNYRKRTQVVDLSDRIGKLTNEGKFKMEVTCG